MSPTRRKAATRRGHHRSRRRSAGVPDAGAYVSASHDLDRSWQKSDWGANHPRLAAVKKKYDPDGLFFVHNGVGSETWSRDGFERVAKG